MARSITEIQQQIIDSVAADSTLNTALTSTSVTAIWRLWTYVVATAIWVHESAWDLFRTSLLDEVAAMKAHTLRWYRQKALDYQSGGTLVVGSDVYNNTGLTAAQIAAQKVIKYAAATEGNGQVVVKIAVDTAGVITAPSPTQIAGVTAYFAQIKDAGVNVIVRGVAADRLKLNVDVYYDGNILASDGSRLDGSSATPVKDAITAFLKNLPFDGKFVKAYLVDAMQQVEGVVVPEIRQCQARRNDDPSFSSVDISYNTYSGFLKIYDTGDLVLNYIQA